MDQPSTVFFLDKNVIIRAAFDSTLVLVLADIGLFFCRPNTFVSVGPFIVIYFFIVGGRHLLLKQSLDRNLRSSSDHRQTVYYVCRQLVNIKAFRIFVNGGRKPPMDRRKPTEGQLVYRAILIIG